MIPLIYLIHLIYQNQSGNQNADKKSLGLNTNIFQLRS